MTSYSTPETIILVAHGTRDSEGVTEFLNFVKEASPKFDGRKVRPCFLEFAEPSILDAIDESVKSGAKRIIVMPLFLVPAGHLKNDVSSAVNLARRRYPDVEILFGAHLGVDSRLIAVLEGRLLEVEVSSSPRSREETAVLVVGRGSSDPDGNADVFKVARLLWEGRTFGWVETCFCSITRPLVPEGIRRCIALGAKRVIVIPYFLFTGLLIKRIVKQAEAQRAHFPAVEILNAGYIANHPHVTEILLGRLEEVLYGKVLMSCDTCKYRFRLPGFEHQHGLLPNSDHHHGLRSGHDHHSPEH